MTEQRCYSDLIAGRLAEVRLRIAAAAKRSGRPAESVKLVGVTKTVGAASIRAASEAGLKCVGENYVQEGAKKQEELSDLGLEWHLIGRVQSNKAKVAASRFDMIQTIDRAKIADAIANERSHATPQHVLVQVFMGGSDGRAGAQIDEIPALVEHIAGLPGLALRGLMGVPPPSSEINESRRYFSRMREVWQELGQQLGGRVKWDTLSMGMSGDFELAIEEGATLVRVGSAIFGVRP